MYKVCARCGVVYGPGQSVPSCSFCGSPKLVEISGDEYEKRRAGLRAKALKLARYAAALAPGGLQRALDGWYGIGVYMYLHSKPCCYLSVTVNAAFFPGNPIAFLSQVYGEATRLGAPAALTVDGYEAAALEALGFEKNPVGSYTLKALPRPRR